MELYSVPTGNLTPVGAVTPPTHPMKAPPSTASPEVSRKRRRGICGSTNEAFSLTLFDNLMRAALVPRDDDKASLDRRMEAAMVGLKAFAPRDEVEGMMAAQAVALHHAAQECLHRSFLPEQEVGTADRLRRQAANLSRTMIEVSEAIERRRGGGARQVVRVERVVVQDGGQAIVGAVTPCPRGEER
ncbi:hypothetical protein [Belnapia moabensis]|uniref:hypothetical protein n=1 Tax=Belnapia moabensis TaxID=365533 RepID=UPI0012EE9573|nr:hypothetical protein [Belnapia moabensis]